MGYVIGVQDSTAIQIGWLTYQPSDAPQLEREWAGWCGEPKEIDGVALTRRSEWLASRVILQKMLASRSLVARLDKNPDFGFPELRDGKTGALLPAHVSWSHTEGFAVVALGPGALGIDAEPLDRPIDKVLSRIAGAEEVSRVGNPRTADGLELPGPLALWCAKEAAAKATGLGMRWGLRNFELVDERDGVWSIAIDKPGPRGFQEPAVRFLSQEGFAVALCSERALLLTPPPVVLVR